MSEREAEKSSCERWNVKKVRSEMSDGAKESNWFLLVEVVMEIGRASCRERVFALV